MGAIGLSKRIQWFREWSQLLESGHPLVEVIPFPGLKNGKSLTETLRRTQLFSPLDIAMIYAGETMGQIPIVLTQLSRRYERILHFRKKFLGHLAYPLFILIVGIFVAPVFDLFLGRIQPPEYLLKTIGSVVALFFFVWLFTQLYRIRSLRSELYQGIPIVSGLMHRIDLERWLTAMALLLQAGVPMPRTLEICLGLAEGRRSQRWLSSACILVEKGKSLTQAFKMAGAGKESWVRSLEIGEKTGKIPENTLSYSQKIQQEIDSRLKGVSQWVPRLIYFAIVIWIAVNLLGVYSNISKEMTKLLSKVTDVDKYYGIKSKPIFNRICNRGSGV